MFKGLPGSLQTYCVCLSCFHVICTTRLIFAVLQLCSYHWTLVSAQRPSEVAGSKPAPGLLLLTYLQNWGLYFFKKLLNWDTVMRSSAYCGNTCYDRSRNLGFLAASQRPDKWLVKLLHLGRGYWWLFGGLTFIDYGIETVSLVSKG